MKKNLQNESEKLSAFYSAYTFLRNSFILVGAFQRKGPTTAVALIKTGEQTDKRLYKLLTSHCHVA